ncbi:MAG: hypothetical protein HY706_02435 [Candidatus Hydrogenedentes bacterium]|nr:hypothetical protein [Candidatus Hydrogenedentota bacterium]
MVDVNVVGDKLSVRVLGLHQFWALKKRIELPLAHVVRAQSADPSMTTWGWWKGWRCPGTYLPGVIVAGTFYCRGQRIFWDVCNPRNAIVIELKEERYQKLIIEVASPAATIEVIRKAVDSVRRLAGSYV